MLIPWISKIKNSKKKTVKTAIVFISVFFFCLTFFNSQVLAQSDVNTFEGGIEVVDQNIALAGTDIRIIVSRIINVFLGLLGIIDLSLMIYAGYIWMTSGGDEGKITEAKATLRNAVIGLIIILSAFAIVSFLFSVLDGRSGGVDDRNRMTNNTFYGSGALGSVIKDHYPMRDQKDVPRNTSIVVTFALPVESSSFIVNSNNSCYDGSGNSTTTCDFDTGSDPYYGDCIDLDSDGIFDYTTECDRVNTSSIKIINLAENPDLESRDYFGFENPAEAVVFPSFEDGNQRNIYTIVIRPLDYLGSPMENQDFSVYLSEDILQKNSTDSIFVDQYAKYYYWNFEINTELDLTPPEVESISPVLGQTISKNEILQINFSEAVDPTMVSGDFSSTSVFDNILVNGEGEAIPGKWQITNGYRTVEFISNEPCGQNSCGDMMYCLPVVCGTDPDDDPKCSNLYKILLRTANTSGNIENPFEANPFTGIYDLAMNALNNIDNDTAEILKHEHIEQIYGDNKIYEGVDLSICRGDKVAFVGSNGSGKSTLLKILAGVLEIDKGSRIIGHKVNNGYYPQHRLDILNTHNTCLAEIEDVYHSGGQTETRKLLGSFLFSGDDVYKKVSVLSGGEKSRLVLIKILANPPNFLLMDEPINHLDIPSRDILIEALSEFTGTLCFISHDVYFIRKVANKIIEIKDGKLKIYPGGYDYYIHKKEVDEKNRRLEEEPKLEDIRNTAKADRKRNIHIQKTGRDIPGKIFAEIEKELVALSARLEEINRLLSDPAIYKDNSFISLVKEQKSLKVKIDELTFKWESYIT